MYIYCTDTYTCAYTYKCTYTYTDACMYQYEIEFYTVECSGGSLYTVGSLLIQMGNPLRIATVVNRPVR